MFDWWDRDVFDPEEFGEAYLYGLIPGYTPYQWITQPGVPTLEQVVAGIWSTATSWSIFYFGHQMGYFKVPFGVGARMSGAFASPTGRTFGQWALAPMPVVGTMALSAGVAAGHHALTKPGATIEYGPYGSVHVMPRLGTLANVFGV